MRRLSLYSLIRKYINTTVLRHETIFGRTPEFPDGPVGSPIFSILRIKMARRRNRHANCSWRWGKCKNASLARESQSKLNISRNKRGDPWKAMDSFYEKLFIPICDIPEIKMILNGIDRRLLEANSVGNLAWFIYVVALPKSIWVILRRQLRFWCFMSLWNLASTLNK